MFRVSGHQCVIPLIFFPLGTEGRDHCGWGHCGGSIPRPRHMEQGQSAGGPVLWTGRLVLCGLWGQWGAAQRQPLPYEVRGGKFNEGKNIWQSVKGDSAAYHLLFAFSNVQFTLFLT